MKGLILVKNSSGIMCDDCIFHKDDLCLYPVELVGLIEECSEPDMIYQIDYVKRVDNEADK